MKLRLLAILICIAIPGASALESIIGSKHDLSASGPGPLKAATESEICLFCHTPHHANQVPLWNHTLSTATYVPYSSSTAKATIGQPTGASKLCLSCHDGTVALGMVSNRKTPIAMQGSSSTIPPGSTSLGTDLSDDHPISFPYNSALASAHNGQLKDPTVLTGKVHPDHNSELQCTSCHDPHNNEFGKFLLVNNTASALCLTCHAPTYWSDSTHRTSTKTWNSLGLNPWPHTTQTTVAANACENCHAPHSAGTPQRLLNFAGPGPNCYPCHNSNVASKNVQTEFTKLSVHPIDRTPTVHDPTEDSINPPRHVECVDCHNPHATKNTTATAPNATGRLAGVTGVNSAGAVVTPLSKEYELCFRCHADSIQRGPATVTRQFPETNLRLLFSSANTSFHPVEAAGKNATVPSLLAPLTATTVMYCTDCHNNDQGPGAGGSGPNGPHGSAYVPLLERQLTFGDFNNESAAAYALCYKCHSRDNILSDQSFTKHKLHIVDQQTACTTCHDSHGVVTQPHLINFNTTYVTASSNGRLEYISSGPTAGNCSLTCHGTDHNAQTYSLSMMPALQRAGKRGKKPSR